MSVDDMMAAVALGVESALSKMGFVQAKDAPTPPKPAANADELRGKRLASLAKARAAKQAKAKAKPAAKAAPAAKQAKPAGKAEWSHEEYTTSKGVDGVIVRVGIFSAFIPNGDADKRKALLDTVNATRVNSDAMTAALRAAGCNL